MTAPYTLSSSYRAHECPQSCTGDQVATSGDGQAAGSARHAFIAAVAQIRSNGASAEHAFAGALTAGRFEAHHADLEALDMEALEPFLRPGQWAYNVAVAWHPESGEATILGHGLLRAEREVLAEAWRQKRGFSPGSVTHGEADVVGLTADAVVVLDFKPPWGQAEHFESWKAQVEGYAAPLAAAYGKSRAICVVLQLRPGARPTTWELDALDLEAVRARHAATLRHVRDGDAPYRVGGHCTYCPRLRTCPAQAALIVSVGTLAVPEADLIVRAQAAAAALATAPDAIVEAAYFHTRALRKDGGVLDVMWRALKPRLSAHPVTCADGEVLGVREVVDADGGVDWEIAARVMNAQGFSGAVICAAIVQDPASAEFCRDAVHGLGLDGHQAEQLALLLWRHQPLGATKDSIRAAVQASLPKRGRGNGAVHAKLEQALQEAGAFATHGVIKKFKRPEENDVHN